MNKALDGFWVVVLAGVFAVSAGAQEDTAQELRQIRQELQEIRAELAEQGKMFREVYDVVDAETGLSKKIKERQEEKGLLLESLHEVADDRLSSVGCPSPTAAQFAVITTDGGVNLYDDTGTQSASIRQREHLITAVAYSPDGDFLLTGSRQGVLHVWNLADPRSPAWTTEVGVPVDRVAWVGSDKVAWGRSVDHYAPGGKLINHDQPSGAVLDRGTGRELWRFRSLIRNDFQTLAAAQDGSKVAVMDVPGELRGYFVLNGATGEFLARLHDESHTSGPLSAAFSPDGRELAAGYAPYDVILWDVEKAESRRVLKGHSNWVVSMGYSRDGKLLISGAGDSTARVWDTATGREIGRIRFPGPSTYVEGVGILRDPWDGIHSRA